MWLVWMVSQMVTSSYNTLCWTQDYHRSDCSHLHFSSDTQLFFSMFPFLPNLSLPPNVPLSSQCILLSPMCLCLPNVSLSPQCVLLSPNVCLSPQCVLSSPMCSRHSLILSDRTSLSLSAIVACRTVGKRHWVQYQSKVNQFLKHLVSLVG